MLSALCLRRAIGARCPQRLTMIAKLQRVNKLPAKIDLQLDRDCEIEGMIGESHGELYPSQKDAPWSLVYRSLVFISS